MALSLPTGTGPTRAAGHRAGVRRGDAAHQPVARVVLLFCLMPLWAVLLARVLLDERLTALAAVRVAMAVGGAAIVL